MEWNSIYYLQAGINTFVMWFELTVIGGRLLNKSVPVE